MDETSSTVGLVCFIVVLLGAVFFSGFKIGIKYDRIILKPLIETTVEEMYEDGVSDGKETCKQPPKEKWDNGFYEPQSPTDGQPGKQPEIK